jgi:uncharacterized pyridoxal phosphate-containing UPF0001 family protein
LFQENETLFGEMKQENRDCIDIQQLSMGIPMIRWLLFEGATIVRADSAIFEKGDY